MEQWKSRNLVNDDQHNKKDEIQQLKITAIKNNKHRI